MAAEKANQLDEAEKAKSKELAAANATDDRSGGGTDVQNSGSDHDVVHVCISRENLLSLVHTAIASYTQPSSPTTPQIRCDIFPLCIYKYVIMVLTPLKM